MWKSIPFIKLESIWNLWSKSPSKVYNSSSFILHLSTHTDIARISQWASPPSFLNYQHFLNIQNIPCSLHLLRSCSIHIISGLDLLKSLNNLLFAHLPFYFHRESKSKSDLATPVPSISYAFSLNFILFNFFFFFFFLFVVDFVIHWNETAKGLHVFPIPIPPPTSLSTRSL